MKIRLTIILLMASTRLLGQVEVDFVSSDIFDFRALKEFDSVVVYNKSSKARTVYEYHLGVLIKEKRLSKGELYSYISYSSAASENSSRFYSLSGGYNGEPRVWHDTHQLTVEKIRNNRVVEIAFGHSSGTDSTMDEKSFLSYDSKDRLKEERILDTSGAYTDMFKPNSSEVDLSNMREVDKEKIKKYNYEDGKLTIEYIIDRKVKGREEILFDTGGRPTKDLFLDQDNNKLGETVIIYDKDGKIIEREWAWYISQSIWGNTGGGMVELDGKETIFYNIKGLPEKVIKKYKGRRPEISLYTYY
jgi:hypothetical protein